MESSGGFVVSGASVTKKWYQLTIKVPVNKPGRSGARAWALDTAWARIRDGSGARARVWARAPDENTAAGCSGTRAPAAGNYT